MFEIPFLLLLLPLIIIITIRLFLFVFLFLFSSFFLIFLRGHFYTNVNNLFEIRSSVDYVSPFEMLQFA